MQSTTVQHYRLTLDQAKQDYKDGLLTATGLVFYAIAILRPPGQKLRITKANDFAEQLGIKKTSFYRALSLLKLKDLLDWEPTEGLILWVPLSKGVAHISDSRRCQAQPTAESRITTLTVPDRGIESQIAESQSQIAESQSQIAESQSQIAESQSQIAESEALKPLLNNDFRNPPDITDIYQIFLISLSNEEREIFKTFSRKTVGKLPNTPVLPKKWIEAHHVEIWEQYKNTNVEVKAEIKQESEIDRKAIAPPTNEQIAKLQELQKAGEIKKFYPNSQKSDAVILVDTGSGLMFWWEFFEMANLEV